MVHLGIVLLFLEGKKTKIDAKNAPLKTKLKAAFLLRMSPSVFQVSAVYVQLTRMRQTECQYNCVAPFLLLSVYLQAGKSEEEKLGWITECDSNLIL